MTGASSSPAGNSTLSRFVSASSRPWNVQCPFAAERVERGQLVVGRRRRTTGPRSQLLLAVARPQPIRVGGDLVVRPPAQHRARVILRGPSPAPRARRACAAQPLLLARSSLVGPHEHEPAPELLAEELDVDLAVRAPPSPASSVPCSSHVPAVPDDDVAAAVLTLRDDAFEVDVLERVVLDVHREVARPRVERQALRDRPARRARRPSRGGSRSGDAGPGAAARRSGVALGEPRRGVFALPAPACGRSRASSGTS